LRINIKSLTTQAQKVHNFAILIPTAYVYPFRWKGLARSARRHKTLWVVLVNADQSLYPKTRVGAAALTTPSGSCVVISHTTAPSLPSAERQAELIANIEFAQREYDDSLRAEGRSRPHRPT